MHQQSCSWCTNNQARIKQQTPSGQDTPEYLALHAMESMGGITFQGKL